MLGGRATGLGPLPGSDAREAAAAVVDELPVPHLVQLPARGPGADALGRVAGLLPELPIDTSPRGYRLGARHSAVARAARSYLDADIDALDEAIERAGRRGGTVKVQVLGPWSLTAMLETSTGARVLRDPGARRDIADMLGEAMNVHAGVIRKRTGAELVVVQFDEPALPEVLGGRLTPRSKLEVLAPIPIAEAGALLDRAVAAAATPVVLAVPTEADSIAAALAAAPAGLALDLQRQPDARALDALGGALDATDRGGAPLEVLAAVVGATRGAPASPESVAERVIDVLRTLGQLDALERVGFSPASLESADPQWALEAMRLVTRARDVAEAVAKEHEA